MSDAQIEDAVPNDANATPIPMVIPSTHGDIRALALEVPVNTAVQLSSAAEYPLEAAEVAPRPTRDGVKACELTGWALYNDSDVGLIIGGKEQIALAEAGAGMPGIPLAPANGVASQEIFQLSDPSKTYVRRADNAGVNTGTGTGIGTGTGTVMVTLVIIGKFYTAI